MTALAADLPPAAQERSNVIVFLTDDHAQWALGSYGNSEIRTPTLDYLSKSGVQFENGFTPTPVCSPARASFWTGRLPSQHGVHDYLAESDPEVAAVPWLRGETTLAARFKEAGYVTAMVGKWHLGQREETLAGFDYWFSQFGPAPTPTEYEAAVAEPVALPEGVSDWHAITDHAINFLRTRDDSKPFFLFVGHFATHSPWSDHAERVVDQYRECTFSDIPVDTSYPFGRLAGESLYPSRETPRETLAQYYAAVSEIDEQLGRVVDEVEAQGIRGSTLIAYTADHGLNIGHHGLWGKGNASYPYNMVDESIKVPMILNSPGRILGGQRRSEPVTLCDLHDSLLDYAGVEVSAEDRQRSKLPGRSFMPLCRNEVSAEWTDSVFGEYGDLRMVRTPSFKLVCRYGNEPGELFDLVRDPRETTNVIKQPAYAEVAAELRKRLTEYFERYEDPEASGLNVATLPRHNKDEAWRDDGVARLAASADWIETA